MYNIMYYVRVRYVCTYVYCMCECMCVEICRHVCIGTYRAVSIFMLTMRSIITTNREYIERRPLLRSGAIF